MNKTFYATCLACLILLGTMCTIIKASYETPLFKYPEIYIINELYGEWMLSEGICLQEDHHWEETSNALDIPLDSLTIEDFIYYLLY